MRAFRQFWTALALVAAVGVAYGFAGSVHRSADSIAMLRPIFCCVVVLGAFSACRVTLKVFFVVLSGVAFATVISPFWGQEPGGDLRIYSKNLWYGNAQMSALATDIREADVDAVLLQEVTGNNIVILDILHDHFPYQHLCGFSGRLGIAVLSRHPFVDELKCSDRRALAAAQIELGGKVVWLVSAHIPWPWPRENGANESSAEELFAALDGAVVIGGDFNIMPWSGRVSRVAYLTRTRLAGPVRPTLRYKGLPLPIDFALAPFGGSMELRPLLGADHAGVVADLGIW